MRSVTVVALLAFTAIGGPTRAHLRTPYQQIGDAIKRAKSLAIVEVVVPSEHLVEETHTRVRLARGTVGAHPPEFTAVQIGAHIHDLRKGERVLMPLTRSPSGRWIYEASTREPMTVAAGKERAVERFVRDWRAHADEKPERRLRTWIALTRHSAAIARRAAFEALIAHADRVRPALDDDALEDLASGLFKPEASDTNVGAIVRLVGLLANERGAALLANRFGGLRTLRAQHLAAGVIARHPSATGRAAIARCAETAPAALAERCRRLLPRFGPPRSTVR